MSIPYVTVAEFMVAVDVRALSELGGDTDADATVNSGNVILTHALTRASHQLRSFVLRAGQYTSDQLDEIQAEDDWTLKGLVCDLAVLVLISRRVGGMPESWKDKAVMVQQTLEDIKKGLLIFGELASAKTGGAAFPSVCVVPIDARARLGFATDQQFYPQQRSEVV